MPLSSMTSVALPPPLAHRVRESGLSFVITGGSGWLGQATLAMLEQALGDDLSQRVHVFGSSQRPLSLPSGRVLLCRELAELQQGVGGECLVLHYAFLTRDRVNGSNLDDYIHQNRAISDWMADCLPHLNVKGLFVPSSGAVYGPDRQLATDLTSNPYGVLKREDEIRFQDMAGLYGWPVVICRLFNLAGPCINKVDNYALASILCQILRGGPVQLAADCPVIRSYVHVGDLLHLAVSMMLSGETSSLPFDSAGERDIEIGELAVLCARLLGRDGMEIERPAMDMERVNRYVGDRSAWDRLCRAHGVHPRALEQQILDTTASLTC